MTDEERKAQAAARKAAYRRRKKETFRAPQEALHKEDAEYYARKLQEERQAGTPLTLQLSAEEADRLAEAMANEPMAPIRPISRKEQVLAILADSQDRHARLEEEMKPLQKYASNPTNILLYELIRTTKLARMELIDLIGGLK